MVKKNEQELEDFIKGLTYKQVKFLFEVSKRPVPATSNATISTMKVREDKGMGGIVGTLRREKYKGHSLIKFAGRDMEDKKLYELNEEAPIDTDALGKLLEDQINKIERK